MSPGQVTTGGVVSTTVTVKLQLLERPRLSVAVHVTLLLPKGKPLPEGGSQITGSAAPAASIAITS
ncbi:MAG TPA: hypothetical protein VEO53_09255 [Candidatus Binatia bacterium]|nr:hypothetical protein [Candidatus Binatia bacterium]